MCKKILSFLLAFTMIFSLAQMKTNASTVVLNETDLRAAIEAIPVGGTGEITIGSSTTIIDFALHESLNVENKDITFNLVNVNFSMVRDENGSSEPLISGFGSNITINANENSSVTTQGHTRGAGVIRIDNSTDWNETTQSFEEDFTLTINGGKYTCTDTIVDDVQDYVFIATPGIKVNLTDVMCNGKVEAIAMEGVGINVPGQLKINSGRFTNDVENYTVEGKNCYEYNGKYYVRSQEMTDEFKTILTNGKLVFNYVTPSVDDEAIFLLAEDFNMMYPDFYLDPATFNDDFTKVEIKTNEETPQEEVHLVDVIWNYDEDVNELAKTFIEKFPKEERPWFNVSDLELVNCWVFSKIDEEIDSIANYSSELKSILGNTNFLYEIEVRGGAEYPFYTENIGSAKLMHNGITYFSSSMIGARAEHAIYVPENTADTKEALVEAALKRIEDYIGKGYVSITAASETVNDYYNKTIATFDKEMADAQATLDAEMAKPENERDIFVIWDCQSTIEYTPSYKEYFINQFNEGGDLYFLNNAAGDYFFNIDVIGREESYPFVIIKDDSKLTVPTYTSVDLHTNVVVLTDSSSVPLDTTIEVDKLTEGTEYERIMKILNVEEDETFDIKLHSGTLDDYVTKLEDDKFEVKLPIPEKFEGKTLVVYYVDENDSTIEYEVTIKDGYAVFITNHFSIYSLVQKDTNEGNRELGGEAIPEPEINTEVEKLPAIDTTKPVDKVTVGTTKTAQEVINETVKEIIEAVKEDKKVTKLSKKVVDAIKEQYQKGNDVDLVTEVVVKTLEEKEVAKETIKKIAETVKESKVAQYLDLSVLLKVLVDDKELASGIIAELSKPITFTIAIPEELARVGEGYEREYFVIREHDGKIDKLPVTVNKDGSLSFTTDKFSTYALVYVDKEIEVEQEVKPEIKPEVKPTTPETSDNSHVMIFALVALASLAILLVLKKKEELSK